MQGSAARKFEVVSEKLTNDVLRELMEKMSSPTGTQPLRLLLPNSKGCFLVSDEKTYIQLAKLPIQDLMLLAQTISKAMREKNCEEFILKVKSHKYRFVENPRTSLGTAYTIEPLPE